MITVDPRTRRVTWQPEFYVMKHCSGFIVPGARRLVVTGPWAGNSIAFANPDGARVLVVHNPFPVTRPLRVAVLAAVGLPARSFNTFVMRSRDWAAETSGAGRGTQP